MGVLNWVQNRRYGTHQRKRKTELSADSDRSAETSIGLHQTCEPEDRFYWSTAMLSIGTFGTTEGQRLKSLDGSNESCMVGVDEPKKMQGELRLLMGGRVAAAEETNMPHRLHLERLLNCTSHSQNGGTVKPRSIRKPLTSAFNGFMPRPSFKEPVPEMRLNETVWQLLHKTAVPSKNSAFHEHARDDRVLRMPPKVKAGVDEEMGKWIKTDSEYIVLEI